MSLMILVHPGSLCGSARSLLGKFEADAVKDEIFYEVEHHQGGLVVIDGFLSIDLSDRDNQIIEASLRRSRAAGQMALRLWGCDAGEAPIEGWSGFGKTPLVFGSQEEAAASITHLINEDEIEVTGAWATESGNSGCVCSVVDVLRASLPDHCKIKVSQTALMEPFDDLDDDFDDLEIAKPLIS